MKIRPVGREDRSEWLRMLVELYGPGGHEPYVDAFLSGAPMGGLLPSAVFVCERDEGGLAGLLELSIRNYAEDCTGPTPYIETWYVDADARGTGIGRALVSAAEEWAKARGFTEMASDTWLANVPSQDAHRAVGFEEVERVVHYRKALGRGER